MTHTIHVYAHRLTDGSEVFDVILNDHTVFNAVTEKDAHTFCEHLAKLIEAHLVDELVYA
jgi:hypothetical protein